MVPLLIHHYLVNKLLYIFTLKVTVSFCHFPITLSKEWGEEYNISLTPQCISLLKIYLFEINSISLSLSLCVSLSLCFFSLYPPLIDFSTYLTAIYQAFLHLVQFFYFPHVLQDSNIQKKTLCYSISFLFSSKLL